MDSGGRTAFYSYTARGELYQLGSGSDVTTYTFDAAGDVLTLAEANATTVTNVWDAAGRLQRTALNNSSGSERYHFAYTYDVDGRRATADELDAQMAWGYDGLGHMTSAVRSGNGPYSESYAVDGVGNRTAQTVGGVGTTFAYDVDDELNGSTHGWTGDGATATFAYDYDETLTQATMNGSASSYVSDALGRRFSRTDSAGNVTDSYFDGGQPLTDWKGGSLACSYLYGNGLVRDNAETVFCDGVGSVRRVTGANQADVWDVNCDSFGNVEGSLGATASPLGFGAQSGYRGEGDCHLLLSGARSWDTTTGRFLTRDTDLGQSPYAYCGGDPVNFCDPSGHGADSPFYLKWQAGQAASETSGNSDFSEAAFQSSVMQGMKNAAGGGPPSESANVGSITANGVTSSLTLDWKLGSSSSSLAFSQSTSFGAVAVGLTNTYSGNLQGSSSASVGLNFGGGFSVGATFSPGQPTSFSANYSHGL